MQSWTNVWSSALNVFWKRPDPVKRDILFISKVNVENSGLLLVSTDSLHQATIPVLDCI